MRTEIDAAMPRSLMTRVEGDGGEIYRAHSSRRIARVEASNVGNGFVRIASPVDGLVLEDARISDVYRVIENSASRKGEDASVRGLRIQATGTIATAPHDLPVGIAFAGTAHDFQMKRCIMRGFRWQRGEKKYWNGDGYSAERGNHGLLFRRCAAYDNSDGGFDLKSSATVLDDCIAGGNARNYRLWTSIRATRLTSLEPRKIGGVGTTCHFSLMGSKPAPGRAAEPSTITIAHLVVRSERGWPIFAVHDGPVRIIIGSHDIQVPSQTPLVRMEGGAIPGGIVWRSGPPPNLN